MVQTKAELREQIKNLEAQLRDVKAQLSNQDEIIKKAKEDAVEEYKNKEYRMFIEHNGEFLDRYMTEFLSEKLSIQADCEDNFIDVKLSVNGEVISSSDSYLHNVSSYGY